MSEPTQSPQTTQTGDFSTNVPKSGEVPQLTAEQEKRFDDAYDSMQFTGTVNPDYTHTIDMEKIKTHLATELALQRREYENVLNEAIELLEEQIDDEPCSYDHHGYCQTHWGGTDEDPTFCGMKKSKEVIQKCKALLQKEQ